MYRPRAFAVDDRPALHEVIRNRVFATFALVHEGRVQFAYAPVVVDADANEIRFHLAKANPVAALADGARVAVSFAGPDAYVSPDWYETGGLVPTWNYIAVEGEGIARTLTRDELLALLGDLSAQEEKTLFPKTPWTLEKLGATRIDALLHAIEGFALGFERLEGKFKLSQDKKPADFERVIAALEASGDAASRAVASAMRTQKSSAP